MGISHNVLCCTLNIILETKMALETKQNLFMGKAECI